MKRNDKLLFAAFFSVLFLGITVLSTGGTPLTALTAEKYPSSDLQAENFTIDQITKDMEDSTVVTGPDLTIADITVDSATILYGDTPWTWVTFTIKNSGDEAISDSSIHANIVEMTKDGAPYSIGGYLTVAVTTPFDPGMTATKSFAVGHDSAWPVGSYALKVMIDDLNSIAETDETNNISPEVQFDVVNDGPDLRITDISIDSPTVLHQATPWTWVHFTVKNIGTQSIADSSLHANIVDMTKDGAPYSVGGYISVSGYTAPMDPGETATHSFAVGHDAAWPPGVYALKVMIDDLDSITEGNEGNNVSPEIRFTVLGNGPDLVITDISIDSPTILHQATPWTWVHFTVKNTGTQPVADTSLHANIVDMTKDGAPYSIGGYINVTSYTAPLDPGETATHSFAVGHDAAWPPGTYALKVMVDDLDSIAELNETNNVSPVIRFTVLGNGPDLVITDITIDSATITYEATPWTWVHFTVKNQGDLPVESSYIHAIIVEATKDGSPYTTSGYINITGYTVPLGPGETATHSFAVGHDAVWPPGEYTLKVMVDDLDAIAELDESNNVSPVISFTVAGRQSTSTSGTTETSTSESSPFNFNTPGFELLAVIMAGAGVVIFRRARKK
ncbi:MAG: CARDB domain-containing protein [Candidatus Odinarchaeota archaeon]